VPFYNAALHRAMATTKTTGQSVELAVVSRHDELIVLALE